MNDDQFRNTVPSFLYPRDNQPSEDFIFHTQEEQEEPDSDVDVRRTRHTKKKKKRNNEVEVPPLDVNYQQPAQPAQEHPPQQISQPLSLNQSSVNLSPSSSGTPNNTHRPLQDDSPIQHVRQPVQGSPGKSSLRETTERVNGGLSPRRSLLEWPSQGDEYKVASFAIAEQFFLKMAYRHKVGEEYQEYSVYSTENIHLKKYGLGLYLYLEFTKQIGFFFLIMAIFGCVNMVFNYTSEGLSGYSPSFSLTMVKTTLGNNNVATNAQVLIQTIISGLISLTVLVFMLHWRRFSNKIVDESLEQNHEIDPEKYLMIFSGMQKTIVDPQKVKRFIDKTYPVYEVSVIYDYQRKFSDIIDLEEIKHDFETQKITSIIAGRQPKNLLKLEEKFNKKHKEMQDAHLVRLPMYLVVHFEKVSDMLAYQTLFTRRHLINSLGQKFLRCITCGESLPPNYRYEPNEEWLVNRVKLGKPEDIIWENMDMGSCQWLIRRAIGILLILVSLFITASLICLSTLYIATTSSCTDYTAITLQQAQIITDQNTLFCYCQDEIFAGFTDDTIKSICQSLNTKIFYTNALQISASLVSAITNVILSYLIVIIVKMMKPKSKSTMYSNIFIFNFLAVLLNSIVLPLLINASIFDTKPVLYVSFLNFFDLAKLTMYSDFQKGWYVYIGPYYINLIIISCIMPIIDLVKVALFTCIKRKRLQGKSGQMIQKEMNMSIIDYEFELPIKLSSMLVNILLVLLYAANMPILLPLEVLALIITFYCNKAIILKFSTRLAANEELNYTLLNIFAFILLFNLAFSVWSLTCPDIFSAQLFDMLRINFIAFPGDWDRAFYINFLTVMLTLALLYLIIDYTIIAFFKAVCICECRRSITVAALSHDKLYSERVKKENMISSYNLSKNPRYAAVSCIIKQIFSLELGMQLVAKIPNMPMQQFHQP